MSASTPPPSPCVAALLVRPARLNLSPLTSHLPGTTCAPVAANGSGIWTCQYAFCLPDNMLCDVSLSYLYTGCPPQKSVSDLFLVVKQLQIQIIFFFNIPCHPRETLGLAVPPRSVSKQEGCLTGKLSARQQLRAQDK